MSFKTTIYSFLALLCFSCAPNTKSTDYAYIGGEIINPKNNRVVLYNVEGEAIDTFLLDKNNRFIHKIEGLKSGLYSIRHGVEYQMVLLEPNDSLMFRLNTYDFDESLVFTGYGSKKNNYLIKTYLTNEREAEKLIKYAQMAPENFQGFIEKRQQEQLKAFKEFLENKTESPFFESVIRANINYNSYADKEIYPFAYFGNNKLVHVKDLPETFYAYRDSIDYNAKHLNHFFSYNRFLAAHFDNLALINYYKENDYHSKFNRHSLAYNKSKLDLIDSLVTDETIKNTHLKYKARDFISYNHSQAEAQDMLDYYLSKSTNEKDKDHMKALVASLKLLRKGNTLPQLSVINVKNQEQYLSEIITKPSIIYFWSTNLKVQYRNSHYKAKKLKEQFPNINFISININDNDDIFWRKIIHKYNFPIENEYRFKQPKKALKTLAVNYVNKAIVVGREGKILNPNMNLFNTNIVKELQSLLEK